MSAEVYRAVKKGDNVGVEGLPVRVLEVVFLGLFPWQKEPRGLDVSMFHLSSKLEISVLFLLIRMSYV